MSRTVHDPACFVVPTRQPDAVLPVSLPAGQGEHDDCDVLRLDMDSRFMTAISPLNDGTQHNRYPLDNGPQCQVPDIGSGMHFIIKSGH